MAKNIESKHEKYLKRCIELATESLEAGDAPFGSILVDKEGKIIAEGRNRANELNVLAHPEVEMARWAADNLSPEEIASTTMYTSGEHCTMCSGAHGLVGIGTLVYLSSGEQLFEWQKEFGAAHSKLNYIKVEDVIKNVEVRGPAEGELLEEIKSIQKRFYQK